MSRETRKAWWKWNKKQFYSCAGKIRFKRRTAKQRVGVINAGKAAADKLEAYH